MPVRVVGFAIQHLHSFSTVANFVSWQGGATAPPARSAKIAVWAHGVEMAAETR